MNKRLLALSVAVLATASFCRAESIAFTTTKPSNEWTQPAFDAKAWKQVSSWDELAPQIAGEAWIRVDRSYPIKELNNLVVEGSLNGKLEFFINGRGAPAIKSDGNKDTWPLSAAGMFQFRVAPDVPTAYCFHYTPTGGKPLCAIALKPLPLDYLEENTATADYLVLAGDDYMRETQVTVGRDGKYYMTGTSGTWDFMFGKQVASDGVMGFWLLNQGVQIYVSDDLKKWKSLGYVWQFDRDGTWAKEFGEEGKSKAARAVYAPEIHYLKKHDRYYIVYGPNTKRKDGMKYGLGILESKEPQGPYKEITGDKPLCGGFDGTLFEDDDGSVYLLHNGGWIMKLKDDLSGAAESQRLLRAANYPRVGYEGVYLFKRNGTYYLTGAENVVYKGGYSSYATTVATSKNIYGPYSDRYFAFPSAGHASIFQATDGQWYSSTFMLPGSNLYPGIFPVEFDASGRLVLPKKIGVPFYEEMVRLKQPLKS